MIPDIVQSGGGLWYSWILWPNPWKISQATDHVGLDLGFPETGNRTRDKLNNHPDYKECKASEFSQVDDVDKDNIFGPSYRRPLGTIVMRNFCRYVVKNLEKESQETPVMYLLLLERSFSMPRKCSLWFPTWIQHFSCPFYKFRVYNDGIWCY